MINAKEISRRLTAHIGALAPELLPGGHQEGREWRAGSVSGERGASLGVHLTGQKAGVWADFATGESGDALDLVRAVHGLDMRAALAWSRSWLGIELGMMPFRPRSIGTSRPVAPQAAASGHRHDHWRRIWQATEPLAGTIGQTYLAARKATLPPRGDEAIRFHPACPFKGGTVPAMVALFRDVCSDEACGVHRTALLPDGSDRDRVRGKAMLGRAAGAAIKISPDDQVTLGLGLTEGIENALKIISLGWSPVWAAGSAGAIAQFPVLPVIEELTIFADHDGEGKRAAQACARRWSEAGALAIVRTPLKSGLDWADAAGMR
jgi:hypothetical protein